MKKIYILTAVFALLAMSLNAQLTTTKKKVVKQGTSTVKVVTPPDGYFRMGPSRASTTPVTTFPYTNGFDSQDEWNWWEVIDDNSDGYTWDLSSNRARIRWNTSEAANDWLITAPIHLEAGKTYKFYIDAFAQTTSYPERLEVKLASANTATALSAGTTVISSTDITWTEYNIRTLSNENVTVSATGDYYFGIHAISDANMYYLTVDDLKIDVEDTDPKVTVSRDQLTISDSGTNNTFDVQALNIVQGENLGVTPHNGFSTTCTSSTNNVDTWGFYQNNGSVNGTVAVNYTGRALTASDDIAVGTLGASTTVHVDYVPDLYIYCDNGVSPWNFSANPAVAMVNNGDGTYTATLQNIPANSHILFGRASGLTYTWEGDNNRLFFGASTDGGDWGYGDNTSGYLDTDAENDYPVKYHPIYFSEGGTYTITINANDYTFTIDKLVYPAPENVVATADSENQTATVTWDAPSNLPTETGQFTWDFESQSQANEWTLVNVDGDSYNWQYFTFTDGSDDVFTPHSGTYCMRSASYVNNIGALNPNNWMISPEVQLGGTLTLWAKGTDTNDFAEKFGVYVYQGSYNSGTSGFVQVGADKTTTLEWSQYTFDLSQYQGKGRIAIVHHNVTNMYWLLVDDIVYTAEIPIEPESYNIYLDGQLVGSVNANDPLTYDFGTLALGNHTASVSAIYEGGIESALVEDDFTIQAKTATPTITYHVEGSNMVITATGDGTVTLTVDGQSAQGEGSAEIIIPLGSDERTVTATATAQETGKIVSDPATETITIPEFGRSPMPNITMTNNGDGTYTITVTGTGEVSVYIDDAEHGGTAGDPIATGNGSVSFTVEEHSREMTITVQATNQEGDLAVSRTAEETYTIPAMNMSGYTLLDPQPENASTPIDMSKLMFVDRFSVDIPEDNSHPFMYDYTLEETQVRQRSSNTVEVYVEKTGSKGQGFYTLKQIDNDKDAKLVMDVENAAMDFNLSELSAPFFYTVEREEEADGESYWGWNAILQRTSVGNYKQTLKYDTKGNLVYNYNDTILPGPHVQLDLDTITGDYNDYKAYVPVVWTMGFDRVNYDENNPTHNSYGASVWTTGVADVAMASSEAPKAERQTNSWNSVNWTAEGGPASLYILDNVVATATMPTVNTLDYEPYMFRIFVKSDNNKLRPYTVVPAGDGPYDGEHLDAGEGTTKGPICVWSGYINDPKNNQPKKLTTENGEIDNPDYNGVEITEGTGDGGAVTYTFKKVKVDRPAGYDENHNPLGPWDQDDVNAMFGALDELANMTTISLADLEVFVRFYYIVKGTGEGHTPWIPTRANAESDPAGYGTQSPGKAPDPATGVIEIANHGEIVETIYYNMQGMTSDKPFDGINIVVNRYSDGAISVTKVITK